ncbi:uncharacterized protein EDB93DRAFT_1245690 [Suillus bovinus]|uniref:uncharacterized protein n=1 Tax=Suillus bovinus TaxID=48563 RepID=UPI001B883852|nr:uncharacterized protein EDB93DRAFT_1245690 [Suillus bovinus]KAG2159141.1 hypothetical protein EDB93DRAFT_1245690 [Suillus bovinus]
MGAGAIGYSSKHALYATECDRWGKMAYASSLAETILLEITVVHEGARARKKCGITIRNICEAPGLIELALETVVPKLRKFGGEFIWCVEEFIIRDAAWVDLSNHPPSVPYFYDQCLQPSRKGTESTFKSKQFMLMVVVPEAQWNKYENWLEQIEAEATRTRCTQSSDVSCNLPASATTTSLTENELFLPSVTGDNSAWPASATTSLA